MTSGVVTQRADDTALTAVELVEVLAHCRSITASADYRMLQAASLIHEEREEDFLSEVAEHHSGEADSIERFTEIAAAARCAQDPRSQFGPDGLERATAEVGAVLNVTPARARELIVAGSALRHRVPFTGHALATGRLELSHFLTAVARTALCSPDTIAEVDAHLAQAIFARPPMSRARFTVMVDAVVAEFDSDALLRRRERAEADRKVSVRPDRHAPGQSRMSASLPMASAAEIDAQLEAMAAQPHTGDPRTRDQRRADALLALSRHESRLECLCDDCTAAGVDASESAAWSAVRPTFHIVANLSTLVGLDDQPGFLDGHGIVDADTMRSLLADAQREFLRPTPPAADATGYVPSRKLQALIRAGELCCTFPGCSAPAWSTDIDHTDPFDHRHPSRGGSTVRANLKPLCRFHHRIKTFTAWRDHQDEMGTVLFESPTGHMFLGNAYTGTDLFSALRSPPSRADHPARRHLDELRIRQRDAHRRAVERARDAEPPPPY
ncbi:HNH endonuclease signature motif containing protein [Williamsia sp. Leaf354]|uniref:HNH endonuclease signature motif containing protein n=1 Tax=Williamsia sp. Leaf354 TaxID=1736349 RepID=UPI001F263EC5|nr:HNH endonuclease signature motif containing protein [Williamsia sp. Leaf354]